MTRAATIRIMAGVLRPRRSPSILSREYGLRLAREMKIVRNILLTLTLSLSLAAIFWWVSIYSGHDESAARDFSVQGFICGLIAYCVFWYGRNKRRSN